MRAVGITDILSICFLFNANPGMSHHEEKLAKRQDTSLRCGQVLVLSQGVC